MAQQTTAAAEDAQTENTAAVEDSQIVRSFQTTDTPTAGAYVEGKVVWDDDLETFVTMMAKVSNGTGKHARGVKLGMDVIAGIHPESEPAKSLSEHELAEELEGESQAESKKNVEDEMTVFDKEEYGGDIRLTAGYYEFIVEVDILLDGTVYIQEILKE